VAHASAALRMIGEITAYSPRALHAVILVDVDRAMVDAWREAIKEKGKSKKEKVKGQKLEGKSEIRGSRTFSF
jgi:hypothetical protein